MFRTQFVFDRDHAAAVLRDREAGIHGTWAVSNWMAGHIDKAELFFIRLRLSSDVEDEDGNVQFRFSRV